ncbi:hypothetical protein GFS24_09070 [Chitinophaga sp. SYP-B3965]|uniref:hypothetical protein n=1 Tax=Chitinophaga sp. SYP-B3965 TaxID=2663120 RepID=UPI001299718F|nr:hypothetical protein [Chitinophaga sp. SYP-B3965]MRG45265.1 hypothetical protein [Chitinophaga sp. SYP-B3965]
MILLFIMLFNIDIDVAVQIRYPGLNREFIKDLKVFYLIDNQLVSPQANLGHETGFEVSMDGGEVLLKVFPHIPKDKSPATTILKFNARRQDTLTTFYQFSKAGVRCSKVLYNRALKWDLDNGKFPALRKITIVMNND